MFSFTLDFLGAICIEGEQKTHVRGLREGRQAFALVWALIRISIRRFHLVPLSRFVLKHRRQVKD